MNNWVSRDNADHLDVLMRKQDSLWFRNIALNAKSFGRHQDSQSARVQYLRDRRDREVSRRKLYEGLVERNRMILKSEKERDLQRKMELDQHKDHLVYGYIVLEQCFTEAAKNATYTRRAEVAERRRTKTEESHLMRDKARIRNEIPGSLQLPYLNSTQRHTASARHFEFTIC